MVLNFLLNIHPIILVIAVGILFSVIMVVLTKYTTDQDLLKRLREEMKELQAEMKMLKDNPGKGGEVNKRMMEANMKMMMQSWKPMIFSMIPAILILGWFNSNIAYEPLVIGEEFSVELEFYESITGTIAPTTPEGIILINGEAYTIKDNKVWLVYRGERAGDYALQYALQNDAGEIRKSWETSVIVTASEEERKYYGPTYNIKDQILKTVTVSNKKFTPLGEIS
ncbi:MAG: EMC3/TMCO1 family protein, partial [Nanoarchaeota archaeon]